MVLGECRRRNVPQIWQLLVEKVREEIKFSYHSHFLPHVFTHPRFCEPSVLYAF